MRYQTYAHPIPPDVVVATVFPTNIWWYRDIDRYGDLTQIRGWSVTLSAASTTGDSAVYGIVVVRGDGGETDRTMGPYRFVVRQGIVTTWQEVGERLISSETWIVHGTTQNPYEKRLPTLHAHR